MPLFTIGIPTYNRPQFLERAIKSVLNQTFSDFELIVIDDASQTPQTQQIVQQFNDPRIRFIQNQQNLGIAPNVNRVFNQANGQYIGFLGDDDVFKPNLLEHIQQIILEKGDYQFIAFNLSLVNESGQTLLENYFNIAQDIVFQQYHYVEHHFGGRQKFHIPGTFFVSKEFLQKNSIAYRPDVKGIDVFFSLEVNCYTPIYISHLPLYLHTRHALQESHTQNRPIQWKLQYFSGLYHLLKKHQLQYLEPMLRRCFLPNIPQAISHLASSVEDNSFIHRYTQFKVHFPWITESHPDFLKINLFQCLLGVSDKINFPPQPPVEKLEHLEQYYQAWINSIHTENRGITRILKQRNIKTVAIFGTLFTGLILSLDLEYENISIAAFLDTNNKTQFIKGIPVFHPQWLAQNHVDAILLSIEREDCQEILIALNGIIPNKDIPIISWRQLITESLGISPLLTSPNLQDPPYPIIPIHNHDNSPQVTPVDSYWNLHTVYAPQFKTITQSLQNLQWREQQYPLFKELMQLYHQHNDEVILDYGCGPGNDLVRFLHFTTPKKVIGIDVSLKALALARQRLALHKFDPSRVTLYHASDSFVKIPIQDQSVDYIYSQGVLHHTRNPQEILHEFYRILKPNGTASIMVYNKDSIWYHLNTAYYKMIVNNEFPGLSVDEAFSRNTDGPDCPISRCYTPSQFSDMCLQARFNVQYLGAYLSLIELDLIEKYYKQALQDPRLPLQHKEFLQEIQFSPQQLPMYQGKYAGIGGVYFLTKTP